MKQNNLSSSRKIGAIFILIVVACTITCLALNKVNGNNTQPKVIPTTITAPVNNRVMSDEKQETSQLIQRMIDDRLVDENQGFLIEKNQDKLFINGKAQSSEIASKYLSTIKQKDIRVRVYPFGERLMQHPGAGLIQVLAPVNSSSDCVDFGQADKSGC